MQRARRSTTLFISALLAMTIAFVAAGPASAAPSRSDGRSTVIFVHGFDSSGAADTNCSSYWASAKSHFQANGYLSTQLVTFGYYSGATNCTYKYNGSRRTSITTVAKALANRIYYTYSRHGKKVDVVAHSMGGLAIRSALYHVNRGTAGFPPYLYVEDVVTLGSPHNGADALQLHACNIAFDSPTQCGQMRRGSSFLNNLPQTPSKSRMGTDWTVLSSYDDATVSAGSGAWIHAQHKLQYDDSGSKAISHTRLRNERSGVYRGRVKHSGSWSSYGNRPAPLELARQALYLHSRR